MKNTTPSHSLYLYSIVLVAVIGGLLFGYDTAVISGAEKGLQAFFLGSTEFVYTDVYHGISCSSALIGCIIGSFLSGVLATRFGRRATLKVAGLLFFLSALGSYCPEFLFFEQGKPGMGLLIAFNIYRIIGGIGVGLASAICPMYIAEIAPSNLRGKLVSWNQFAIIFGQLVVYFVNFAILGDHIAPVVEQVGENVYAILNPDASAWCTEVGWRYMFVSEAVPALSFFILLFCVPETPRYLVMSGHDRQALSVLQRINGKEKAESIFNDIRHSIKSETEPLLTYGVLVIFVGIMLSVFQQIVGINAVLYYAPRIFASCGFDNAMLFTVFMGIVNLLFTLVAIFNVERWGRKPLLISGSLGMAFGALAFAAVNLFGLNPFYAAAAIMIYSASFMFSWGPVCWVLISEIFPNTIRGAAVAIAVAFQWIANFVVSSSFVPMYNMEIQPGDHFGHIFVYALYGVFCLLAALFVWRLVPETKGKTLEDMNHLWKK